MTAIDSSSPVLSRSFVVLVVVVVMRLDWPVCQSSSKLPLRTGSNTSSSSRAVIHSCTAELHLLAPHCLPHHTWYHEAVAVLMASNRCSHDVRRLQSSTTHVPDCTKTAIHLPAQCIQGLTSDVRYLPALHQPPACQAAHMPASGWLSPHATCKHAPVPLPQV